ncbi:hypothetical protein ACVJGD_000392 [Bradyrhizobium sp. USDA 10063]
MSAGDLAQDVGEGEADGFGELDLLIFWLTRASLARKRRLGGVDQRPARPLPHKAAVSTRRSRISLLDRAECGNLRQRLACDQRGREFVDVAPHVHSTECELDLATFGKPRVFHGRRINPDALIRFAPSRYSGQRFLFWNVAATRCVNPVIKVGLIRKCHGVQNIPKIRPCGSTAEDGPPIRGEPASHS